MLKVLRKWSKKRLEKRETYVEIYFKRMIKTKKVSFTPRKATCENDMLSIKRGSFFYDVGYGNFLKMTRSRSCLLVFTMLPKYLAGKC